MDSASSLLLQLPEELINEILGFLPLRELVACQLSCSTLNRLSSLSLIWRRHCTTEYTYWREGHNFSALLASPPVSVNWKRLLATRKRQDQCITDEFEDLLTTQFQRSQKMQHISELSYDAKDALLKSYMIHEAAEDFLSRRYWAAETLGLIERAEALKEWFAVASGAEVPLERALGAFDLFIAERPPESLDEIARHFDHLAKQFRADTSYQRFLESQTISAKALILADWLSQRGLVQLPAQERFRNLRNALIGVVLCEHVHEALPIISVSIFCCLAQRLGIDAHPCSYPLKVLAIVTNNTGYSDGPRGSDPVYIDPSGGINGGGCEIPLTVLRIQLSGWGIRKPDHETYLEPASNVALIKRVARNLEESLSVVDRPERALTFADPDALALVGRPSLQTSLHPKRTQYAIDWVNLLFPAMENSPSSFRILASRLTNPVYSEFPADTVLLKNFPAGLAVNASCHNFLIDLAARIDAHSASPPPLRRRTIALEANQQPPVYKVGQVFQHARFQYTAAITGWDYECAAGDGWIQQMGVNRLPRGQRQPFYHVVVAEDETSRYVAEENIKLFTEDVPGMHPALEWIAGKYFRRWDHKGQCFVSNLKDQYPDE